MSDRSAVQVRVLGPVSVVDAAGREIDIRGPRHRAILARLVVARGRAVPLETLVDDLWGHDRPARPVGAVRTFVAALRAALEPDRRPRTPPRLLVTRGSGYAFEGAPEDVDAWCFENEVREVAGAPADVLARLDGALRRWRGPAFAELDAPWARGERARLTEMRLAAVETLATTRLAVGRPGEAVPDLDAHTTEHPWREEGWRLLALALYRSRREGDALAVLRRARTRSAHELGIDLGPALARLETDILRRAPHLEPASPAIRAWTSVALEWDHRAVGTRATLESTTSLLRVLTLHGASPVAGAERQAATVAAAEELDDPELTARVLGAYNVPSIWTRPDDPAASAALAAAARRTLSRLGVGAPASTRVRLLATIALETRGTPGPEGPEAAREAETLARAIGDPALLAQTLAARAVTTFRRAGLAPHRAAVGDELLAIATAHDLPEMTILGHLVLMQAGGALGDLTAAAAHADALDELGRRHDSPLVGVFVTWFRAMRADTEGDPGAEDGYRAAARDLAGTGMPGVEEGLLDLALVGLRLRRGQPPAPVVDPGPYTPWVRPHLLLAEGRDHEAAAHVAALPDPPPGHLLEALWFLAGRAALSVGDSAVAERAAVALTPAAAEIAGAGSGMVTLGPIGPLLEALPPPRHREGPTHDPQ